MQMMERRQLTVLSCALVHADAVMAQFDEEILHNLMQQFRTLHLNIIERFEGYVAQYGITNWLVYFGYPLAHEDDAQRAIRAGLDLIEQLGQLKVTGDALSSSALAVRVGIHTAGVIVELPPTASSPAPVIVGAATSLALRVQEATRPQTVVISSDTAQLVQGHFMWRRLSQKASGAAGEALELYEIQGAAVPEGEARLASPRLTPFVGREAEMGLLRERWEMVPEGQGQMVLIRGEAGIGKSRLVQEFKSLALARPHLRIECRCSPYYQNTAFYPLVEALRRTLRWAPDATETEKWAELDQMLSRFQLPVEKLAPLLGELLGLEGQSAHGSPLPATPQGRRQGLLNGLIHLFLSQTQKEPLLLIVEDVHWSDASTLEFLDLLIEQTPLVPLLVVLTCRPTFEPPWSFRTEMTPIALSRLNRRQVEALVAYVSRGQPLVPAIWEQIVDKSDGVPLFAEELTWMVVESEHVAPSGVANGHVDGDATLLIPSTLQDLLTARLDRQGPGKEVMQWASVLGRSFSYEMLQAVSPFDETVLQETLNQLVQAELLFPHRARPESTLYRFKHALIQEAAYASLLRLRRQAMQQRVAEVLEANFPDLVASQPEWLAHHYTEAGLNEQAIPYWQQAGQQASARSATQEAIAHLTQGLKLIASLPETGARWQQELNLQLALGSEWMMAKGYGAPEVEHAYIRALRLCQQVGDTSQQLPVLRGMLQHYRIRGQLQSALQFGEQMLHLASSQSAPPAGHEYPPAPGDGIVHTR